MTWPASSTVWITAVAGACVSAALFANPTQFAQWDPSRVEVSLIGVDRVSEITVRVRLNRGSFPRAEIKFSDAIAPYVQAVEPSRFHLLPGRPVEVKLELAGQPDLPFGITTGEIWLGNGRRAVAGELPLEIDFVPFELPPDPGPEGAATLDGTDRDGDGVRDDLQRWIAFNYPEDPAARAELSQYSVFLQAALRGASSVEDALLNTTQLDLVDDCLHHLLGFDAAVRATDGLIVQALNTTERGSAYIEYDANLGGQVFVARPPDTWGDDCQAVTAGQVGDLR